MNFSFYMVDSEYCDYLRKSTRPFIGIVFEINGFNYYAPLSSPKPKHLHMKNQIDFLKIKDGIWGAINFNNMIPVPASCLIKVKMRIIETDSKADIEYKNLLSNQLSWCNSNKATILKQAKKLYNIITSDKAWSNLSNRCCKFSINESHCLEYSKNE